MKIRFKKMHPDALPPKKAHASDAAFDLVAVTSKRWLDGMNYGTGLAIEIPQGHVGLIFQRSSICNKNLTLANAVGVIDPGYTGEISFKYRMITESTAEQVLYHKGDRIGQLMIIKTEDVVFEESSNLAVSERNNGSYGSSGT